MSGPPVILSPYEDGIAALMQATALLRAALVRSGRGNWREARQMLYGAQASLDFAAAVLR